MLWIDNAVDEGDIYKLQELASKIKSISVTSCQFLLTPIESSSVNQNRIDVTGLK